jgi:hypothetical protein
MMIRQAWSSRELGYVIVFKEQKGDGEASLFSLPASPFPTHSSKLSKSQPHSMPDAGFPNELLIIPAYNHSGIDK